MRFVCDSCRAQYMISDDKVGPKGVKVRCKKCGFVILVRRQDDSADEGMQTRVMTNPLAPLSEGGETESAELNLDTPAPEGDDKLDPNSLFGDDDEDEIGAIFDSVLNSGSHTVPGSDAGDAALQSTKVLDVASMAKAMDASVADDEGGEGRKHELTPALLSNEWYVAIEENQVGPVGIDKLKEHWDRGEIGPDSLCWRAGMADWLPLSDVSELQRHLAPKPSKPVIVAPASMASSASEAPVSGVFSGSAGAEPSPLAEGGGWKPSAASALASLVKDELDVLARPTPAKKPEAAGSGLLDVPAPAAAAATGLAAAASAAAPSPQTPAQGAFAVPAPAPAPGYPPAPGYNTAPAPGYGGAPGYAPAPYAVPSYQATPHQQKKPIALYAVGGLAVLALIMGGVILGTRGGDAPAPAMAEAPPPAAPVQPPVAVAAAPVAPPTTPAPTEPVAAPTEVKPEEPTVVAAAEPAKPAEAKAEPEEDDEPKRVASRTTQRPRRTSSGTATRDPEPVAKATTTSKSSDPFDDIFGPSSGSSSGSTTQAKTSKPSTYVPPAPSSVPAELGSSDITMAVVGQRTAIASCVKKAKAADPNLGSGRMVMRWTILTTGRTRDVKNQTAQYRGSELDKCVTGIIQGMRFPQHRKSSGQQVDFPFTF